MKVSTDSPPRATYELSWPARKTVSPFPAKEAESDSLPEPLLIGNVLWFVHLRWVVIGALVALGTLALLARDLFLLLGLSPPTRWPFAAAAILLVANTAFLAHARSIIRKSATHGPGLNLWAQIVVDLLTLTMVVQAVGSLETAAPFVYLAHVVLACIFFSRRQSLAVTAIAAGLYTACLTLERWQVVPTGGIYATPELRETMTTHSTFVWLTGIVALAIFFVVWFLASHLSGMVRRRDVELAEANRRLTEAQREKTRHMLRTTHELKAPFAAVAANAQLLLKGSCGPLPEEALEVARRIAARCRRLAVEIQEMLQLANLQSPEERPTPAGMDLADLVRWALAVVEPLAQERKVGVEERLARAVVLGVEDHLKMALANIIKNAVVYSHGGGTVRVSCRDDGFGPVVVVEDEGIGIRQEKLPRIFDDYYRTEEAVRHNKDSTGLGLAIVRHVAQAHGIRVQVESAPGHGTRVTLRFPPSASAVHQERRGEWPT